MCTAEKILYSKEDEERDLDDKEASMKNQLISGLKCRGDLTRIRVHHPRNHHHPLSCVILKKFGIFSTVSKKTQISSCMKSCPVVAELIHVDRQTDITKVPVAFRNFASSYLKGNILPLHTMKAYRIIGNTAPLIVNLKTSGEK
jgi:hypothetical protein